MDASLAVTLQDLGNLGCQNAVTLHYLLQHVYPNGCGVPKMDDLVNFEENDNNVDTNHLKASMCTISMLNKAELTQESAVRLCGNSMLFSTLFRLTVFVVQKNETKIANYNINIAAFQGNTDRHTLIVNAVTSRQKKCFSMHFKLLRT